MTLYTALVIQNQGNNIRCESIGRDKKTGKWAGAINLYHDGSFHTMLVSSKPIFKSSSEAVKHMREIVRKIRAAKNLP
ncbi:hypothetical protein HYT45_02875 [Candidatus Uhrbacteria bacterium]|nr:hypothetical protein [Candidatus Uhrbacteria bacterium]